jgi:methionyl-tRNA formyltransferase
LQRGCNGIVLPPYLASINTMKIYGLCTLESGLEMAKGLVEQGFPLQGLIGLNKRVESDAISGYVHAAAFCQVHNLDFIEVRTYSLSAPEDRAALLANDIDLLLIMGWQRLVPGWLLTHSRHGGLGLHGSAFGIAGGRGRSPQNWGLIFGLDEFHLCLFRLDEGIDSGDVIASRLIRISTFDDIRTSQLKVARNMVDMVVETWRRGRLLMPSGVPQAGEARYMPQRVPEDGFIDFRRRGKAIYNFVRALTRPYPGAFTTLHGAKLKIWRCRPFSQRIGGPIRAPGTILSVLDSGQLVIEVGDGNLLVDEYDYEADPRDLRVGAQLASIDFADQMRAVVARHKARFPDLRLCSLFDSYQSN